MILFYHLFAQVLYFVILPFTWIAVKAGSTKWRHRMAFSLPSAPSDVWLHAASVGEVKIASYLTKYLKKKRPGLSVLLTVVTDAGYRTACDEVGEIVIVRFLPVDASVPVALTMDAVQPKMIGITETEIWPNLIEAAGTRNIPVILINGRMSEKAQRRYKWFGATLSSVLAVHERFFFRTTADAERYAQFGVGDDRATVNGDMKFDAPLLDRSPERIWDLRKKAGMAPDSFVLVGGSTRPGEEEALCRVYAGLKGEHPKLRLILAPRHIDRADEIKMLIEQMGLKSEVWGELRGTDDDAVVIVNVMGLLGELYTAADLAFVGGTLADIGGHNILEPVWGGTPVVYGPSIANVVEASEYVESHNYGRKIDSAEELSSVISDVYHRRKTFQVKNSEEYGHSPTGTVGNYILKRLGHV